MPAKIINMDNQLFCANLCTKDHSGTPLSIHLIPRETSRILTDDEMQSTEIVSVLKQQNLGGNNRRKIKVVKVYEQQLNEDLES